MSNQPTPDIETLKAQHLNQALAFVEEALGQGRQAECKVCGKHENTHVGQAKACFGGMGTVFIPNTQGRQAEAERRAAEWHDRLLEKRHIWQGREGASFVLPILNARTARQQSEAVFDAMHAAYLAGALAAEELGREGK